MSYYPPPNQPPYPPYGRSQGPPPVPPPGQGYHQPPYAQQQSPYPPPQGQYPPPPQGQYGHAPPPPQQDYYGVPSPQPLAGYNSASPQPYGHPPPGQPPYGYGPPPTQPPPQGAAYPPAGAYGAPVPPPAGPGYPHAGPAPPSPGYVPNAVAPGDFRHEADALRKAMKGLGTDEKALISVLSRLDPLQMAAVRSTYSQHIGRDLRKDVKSETSGHFEQGLLAVIDGPLMHDVECVREAVHGIGTKEWLLNDVLLGRSNADLRAIMTGYEHTYHRSLAKDVADDLSFKTADLFAAVCRASRHEESAPINPQSIDTEVRTLHAATAGRVINNVAEVCGIFGRSSDAELRAVAVAFQNRYNIPLDAHIAKEFSGHMHDALLYMLHSATDPAMRDAGLLEESMRGAGTKDDQLVTRIVRLHWNPAHKEQVKSAYRHKFHADLVDRVRSETSGDYQRLMVALLQ